VSEDTGTPLERFPVDLGHAKVIRDELNERLEELHGQIGRIISKVEVNDIPVLLPILGLTHERKVLEKIARALTRAAPMLEEYEKLGKRKALLDLAVEEPGWLAATLGDFTSEFAEADSFAWDWKPDAGGAGGEVEEEEHEEESM
jgi:hypothetical protein